MKNQKVNGYVFITVTVIVTILVSTLTVAISGQNKSIELIQNYEKLRIIEEEISAIELVITEYLNNNLNVNNYLTEIYNAGWPNGWRDYDMSKIENIKASLLASGLTNDEVDGFEDYTRKEGPTELENFKKEAEETGAVGVPHLSFPYNNKRIGMFGREHLGLIRHTMHELGLKKNSGVNWEISHYWFAK